MHLGDGAAVLYVCGEIGGSSWSGHNTQTWRVHVLLWKSCYISLSQQLFGWGVRWRFVTVTTKLWCQQYVVTIAKTLQLLRCCGVSSFGGKVWDLILSAAHVPGVENGLADSLSRNNSLSCSTGTGQPLPCSQGTNEPSGGKGKLDLWHLEQVAWDLDNNSLAKQVNVSGQKHYLELCWLSSLPLLPLTEHRLCSFVAHLAEEGLQHTKVKGYLLAARHLQILAWGNGRSLCCIMVPSGVHIEGLKLRQAICKSLRPTGGLNDQNIGKVGGSTYLAYVRIPWSIWQQFPGDWLTQLDSSLDYMYPSILWLIIKNFVTNSLTWVGEIASLAWGRKDSDPSLVVCWIGQENERPAGLHHWPPNGGLE